ncbi:MAG: hypothetical protein ACJAVK_000887 [Akkermansiaceae bacterium]|jgi:hypothetical protein
MVSTLFLWEGGFVQLEKVTAEIRPRTQWEAIDLGVRLVSEHAISLLKGWLASVLPLCLVILMACYNSIGWGMFLIWWLKPILERVALHPLSRSLFGEHPTWRETMTVLPKELRKNHRLVLVGVGLTAIGWLVHAGDGNGDGDAKVGFVVLFWFIVFGLLFYRSGLSRSLVLPVQYLEGLEGQRYKSRMQILSYRSSSSAVALTFICLFVEVLLFGSQIFFALMMAPEGVVFDEFWTWNTFFGGDSEFLPSWVWVALGLFYFNALSLVAWFYTGAGFGLYVNTRTWTEGWDIELKFKSLGQRLALLLLAFVLLGGAPRLEANQEAQRVLDREEFEVQTRGVYEDEEKESRDRSRDSGSGVGIFSAIGELLFWGIVAAAVGGLIWLIIVNAHLFKKGNPREPETKLKKVTTVAGMNVEPENLPANLLAEAKKLWEEGHFQEALGLLYRGAIASLVARQVVEIEESDTEMDCLRRVSSKGESAHASYFKLLTNAWMSQAYAQRLPDQETVNELWKRWPFNERGRS